MDKIPNPPAPGAEECGVLPEEPPLAEPDGYGAQPDGPSPDDELIPDFEGEVPRNDGGALQHVGGALTGGGHWTQNPWKIRSRARLLGPGL